MKMKGDLREKNLFNFCIIGVWKGEEREWMRTNIGRENHRKLSKSSEKQSKTKLSTQGAWAAQSVKDPTLKSRERKTHSVNNCMNFIWYLTRNKWQWKNIYQNTERKRLATWNSFPRKISFENEDEIKTIS